MKKKLVTAGMDLPNTESAFRKIWSGLCELDRAVPPKNIFRAVVFGSARIPTDHRVYHETKQMARAIAEHGIDIVTGGGPSLMAAANEGAVEGAKRNSGAWSHGVCIENINRAEQPNEFLKRAYQHGLIFTRLHEFVRLGHFGAFILAENGGYGTDLEKAIVHQLLQFEHLNVPLIGIGEMWRERAEWEKKWIVDPGCANQRDLGLMICVPRAMDAVPIVLDAYGRFKQRKAAG